jgi:hypothetical protein
MNDQNRRMNGTILPDLFAVNWASMQVISALEARLTYAARCGGAVLIVEPRVRELGLIDERDWAAVYWMEIRTRQSLVGRLSHWRQFRRAVDEIMQRHGSFGRVFLGQLGEPMSHIAHASRAPECFVLDAGMVTPRFARARARSSTSTPPTPSSVIKGLLGLHVRPPPRVTFFSAYDIETAGEDSVVNHDYARLREYYHSAASAANETWIIGQNFVEGGMLDRAGYLRHLERACSLAKGKRVYVAHPREQDDHLAVLQSTFDLEIRRFRRPVEIELLAGPAPNAVVGFCSSALYSIRVLMGRGFPIDAVQIRGAEMQRFGAGVDSCYEALGDAGITVVAPPQ